MMIRLPSSFATILLLSSVLSFLHPPSSPAIVLSLLFVGAESIEITSSGETIIDSNQPSESSKNVNDSSCETKSFWGNKLSTCQPYQIATLNSSPRRCLHMELSPSDIQNPNDNGDNKGKEQKPTICQNYPNWFDGTNGCQGYEHPLHTDWCTKYGSLDYTRFTPYKAKEACCVCGGGTRQPVRLSIGDFVKVTNFSHMDNCKALKIVDIQTKPHFAYKVEVLKGCGRNMYQPDHGTGRMRLVQQFPTGTTVMVDSDDPDVIKKHYRVELRKCRLGRPEQEFVVEPFPSGKDEDDEVLIYHRLTGSNLAHVLGCKLPMWELEMAFEEDLFEGSGEYFFLTSREGKGNHGTMGQGMGMMGDDGSTGVDNSALLSSGSFGEQEYSEVELTIKRARKDLAETPFSMWAFLPVEEKDGDDGDEQISTTSTTTNNVSKTRDPHAEWLERMTHLIGIDYLEEMAPWHLLDVERDSSKSEVKSRFRELSRYFHPDKVLPEKRDLFEKIFVLLQDAYGGLKSADEADKEQFRNKADYDSQLFSYSKYVVELLPRHWSNASEIIRGEGEHSLMVGENGVDRFILNAASHLNKTLYNSTDFEEESEPTVQLWIVVLYSSRCSMSRTVEGFIDLAAGHLEEHENIKVGAYGCGLYKDFKATDKDVLGISTDPICKQFQRKETPNVHLIVETIPGRKRNEHGELVEIQPDPHIFEENAKFKYFYSAVPDGNSTEFYPQNFIKFARTGKRIWNNLHLVKKMTKDDFADPSFATNVTIVAFLDGTGEGEMNQEIVDAVSNTLPGVARRFLKDGLQVGIASCGYGDDYEEEDGNSRYNVDCSKLDVSWLPDIKVYGHNDTHGTSLLRGQFGDRRDVQIALESMGNVLRMMLGGDDDYDDDDLDDLKKDKEDDGGGADQSCQPPPPPPDYDLDLDEIDGRMEETPLLEEGEHQESIEDETKPSLEEAKKEKPNKPKLAGGENKPLLDGGREAPAKDRISGFAQRSQKRRSGGKVLGSGGGGTAGAIAG